MEGRVLLSTYTVTTLGDSAGSVTPTGTGTFNATTLRAALNAANGHAGADTVKFKWGLTGTISLNTALPRVTDALTLTGPGVAKLTVRRGAAATTDFSVISIAAGKAASLSGLTLAEGTGTAVPDPHIPGQTIRVGGGIYNEGTLTLANSAVTANGADSGGVYNAGTGRATLTNCTVSGNDASGIWNRGTIALDRCTLSGNNGSGLSNDGTATLTRSTISGNQAGGVGNGASGSLTLANCTIAGNESEGGAGGIGNAGTATVTNCTISGNQATESDAGGIRNNGTLTLFNSILTGNTGDYPGPFHPPFESNFGDSPTTVTSASAFNLVGSGWAGGLVNGVNGNQLGVDPKLGPLLTEYGGPTATMALLPGSPAINAGSNALAVGPGGVALATDQRGPGYARVVGTRVDIGAFEVPADRPPATYTVTTLGGGAGTVTAAGPGTYNATTLRAAIAAANAAAGVDTVKFATGLAGTISLSSALPRIVDRLTLTGPGAAKLTVRRGSGGDYSVFSVAPGGTAVLTGVTISNGSAPAYASGGGIVNEGTLTLANGVVSGNARDGIYNTGTLTLTNSTVSGNVGRGVWNTGTATLTNSTVTGSSSTGISNQPIQDNSYGGGNVIGGGMLTLTNSAVWGNSGGGIWNTGTAALTNVTVSGNSATDRPGGGIYNGPIFANVDYELVIGGGTLTMANSTVSGNSAIGDGGGIYNHSAATLTLTNSTVTNNRADSDADGEGTGGGIASEFGATASNTIVAGNFRGTAATADDVSGALGGGSNLVGGDPMLAPLADNGGFTWTHAPLPGSPVIDAGSDALAVGTDGKPLTTDQRGSGFPRIAGARVDVGAFEQPAAGSVLTVTGTAGNDTITVTQSGPTLTITRNGVVSHRGAFEFAGIALTGLDGDDTLSVARAVTLPATLDGGSGNDRLHPGSGADQVIGGTGTDAVEYADDTSGVFVSLDDNADDGPVSSGLTQNVRSDVEIVLGGGGNDALVGGRGADKLFGDADDDLLIDSRTVYDATLPSLRTLSGEWRNTANPYATRVSRLLAGVSGVRITAVNAPNDAIADTLTGGSDREWFVSHAGDVLAGKAAEEIATRY